MGASSKLVLAWGLAAATAGLAGCVRQGPRSPLTIAADRGDAEEVRKLLAAGTPADEVDSMGLTAMIMAARRDRPEVIRVLVAAGATIDLRDHRSTRWTPLIHAIHKRANAAATVLLESGAAPDGRTEANATPLMFAAAYGNVDLVRDLLARGADPRAVAVDGETALWAAAGGGGFFDLSDGPAIGACFPEIVSALLEKAPDLRVPKSFSTRVMHAFADGKCDALLSQLEG